jgi:hypothetical protein
MPMKNPAHPGEILATMYLEPLGLTVIQAAAALKMPRAAFVGNCQWQARRNPANCAEAAKSLQPARRLLAVGAIRMGAGTR